MKALRGVVSILVLVTLVAGCASDVVFIPKEPVEVQMKLLDYYEQPDNKVFVLAVDPGGDFAYAYDYGKSTLKEAATTAVEKCNVQRENQGIVARPYVYAINNRVVYREMIQRAHEAKNKAGQEAQINEAARMEATGEADMTEAPAEAETASEEM